MDNNIDVLNISTTNVPDGIKPVAAAGKQGQVLVSEIHGKYYEAALRGVLFKGAVSGVTVPVNGNNLVSVFSLFNPTGSGRMVELVDFDLGIVLATTVVDAVALYEQAAAKGDTLPSTFTKGTPTNGLIGGNANPAALFCTALTHVGTPTLKEILSTFGAVTSSADNPVHKDFDGKVLLPPGTVVSVAMSTAASTASGIALSMSWAEWLLPN